MQTQTQTQAKPAIAATRIDSLCDLQGEDFLEFLAGVPARLRDALIERWSAELSQKATTH